MITACLHLFGDIVRFGIKCIFKGVHYEMEVMAGGAAVFIVSLDDIRKF